MTGLIIYETPTGGIFAAIRGEQDRWDMKQRVQQFGAGVSDIYALWDGSHSEDEIVHEDLPVPADAWMVACLGDSKLSLLHTAIQSDPIRDYLTGIPESGSAKPRYTVGIMDPRKVGWDGLVEYTGGLDPVYYHAVLAQFVDDLKSPSLVDLKDAHEEYAASEAVNAGSVASGRRFILWAQTLWEDRRYAPDYPMALELTVS